MNKTNQIMEVELPTPEAADLTTRAAQAGISTAEYLGIHVLRSAYGIFHPRVIADRNRDRSGINGPETKEGDK